MTNKNFLFLHNDCNKYIIAILIEFLRFWNCCSNIKSFRIEFKYEVTPEKVGALFETEIKFPVHRKYGL